MEEKEVEHALAMEEKEEAHILAMEKKDDLHAAERLSEETVSVTVDLNLRWLLTLAVTEAHRRAGAGAVGHH